MSYLYIHHLFVNFCIIFDWLTNAYHIQGKNGEGQRYNKNQMSNLKSAPNYQLLKSIVAIPLHFQLFYSIIL